MGSVSIAEAKAQLSALVDRAVGGETVEITRRGKLVARIVAAETPRQRIDIARLRALTDSMPVSGDGDGEFIRRMRDEDRY
jgi:prevent-host-death family protein